MKISEAIRLLRQIKETFGDIDITGGYLADDTPLRVICVTKGSMEVWPDNPNGIVDVAGMKNPSGKLLTAEVFLGL